MGWWSAFGKPRGKNGKRSGPPVNDDLVRREITARVTNRLWLADITEHRTAEGKLYLCAIKDVCSHRVVGYSIDSRTQSRLAHCSWLQQSPLWPNNAAKRVSQIEEAASPGVRL